MKTFTCFICSSKDCEKSPEGTFDICRYGISYIKRDNKIIAKEPKVPLSSIAKNLRHEINPILQLIIQQATKLDPTLSTRVINLDKPLSLIVGSTVILDNFIQMITGVHEFHSLPNSSSNRKINLKNLVSTYFDMYSIIKEDGRTRNLELNNLISEDTYVVENSDFVKYLVAILIDNAWKHSVDDSVLTVSLNNISPAKFNLKFVNKSILIPKNFDLFDMGSKLDESTKGFGYGLNWSKTLESSYNSMLHLDGDNAFKISHKQIKSNVQERNEAFQEFSLYNIILEKI